MVTSMAAPGPSSGIAAGLPNRRLKKLGFKQLLSIQRGSSGAALAGATESAIENDDQQDKGLGVDASEISEHHLQAALSSSQLAADALATADNGAPSAGPSTSKPAYHIPTPDAKAVLMQREYYELYPLGAYSDPVTYVRTSKTVEESVRGPAYILDEDDNEWLEDRNKKASEALALAMKGVRIPNGAVKGKGREKLREEMATAMGRENADVRVISQDEFEMVMTVFEQVTSEKVPFAHLDLSKLPTLDDLLASFDDNGDLSQLAFPELSTLPWEQSSALTKQQSVWSPDNPYRNLSTLKSAAKAIYPWWKTRREDREGKAITPVLNFDESKDDDPYVCFRRREVKMIRKTRKTDAAHLEKLVKLRHELNQGVTLLNMLAQREKTKRASLNQDKACFQLSREFLDVKRQWNISGPNNGQEDEELVSGDKRDDQQLHGVAGAATAKKKRKTEEANVAALASSAAAASAKDSLAASASTATKASANRKARPSTSEDAANAQANGTAANATATTSMGLGSAILDRVAAVQAYIEREVQRKAESDVGWEEGSDSAFQPMPIPAQFRSFRPIHLDEAKEDAQSSSTFPWSSSSPSSQGATPRTGRPASFRRRMGRGGRTWLDRKLPTPSPVPSSLSDWPRPSSPNAGPFSLRQSQAEAKGSSSSASKEESENGQRAQRQAIAPRTGATQPAAREARNVEHPSQGEQQAPLSGPFAFSASIRPSLLTPAPAAVVRSLGSSASLSSLPDQQTGDGNASDASSSTSSQRSKMSATTRATSYDGEEAESKMNIDENDGMSEDEGDEDGQSDAGDDSEHEVERWTRLQERWRYDDEAGRWAGLGLCGLGGMEDDDEAIIDDFDQRFMRFRMNLLEETDLVKLSTDLSNVMQAQAAADAPFVVPSGYSIFRGEVPSMFQPIPQAQVPAQAPPQPLAPQNAQGAQHAAAIQAATMNHNAALARAAQTNVGGPLAALQQQQQQQQAQLQLALQQQQQQRVAQAHAQALAANATAQLQLQQQQQAAAAAAQSGNKNVAKSQQQSPIPRPRSGQLQAQQQVNGQVVPNAQQQQQHALAQSFTAQNLAAALAAGQMGNANLARFAPNGAMQFSAGVGNGAVSSPQMQAQVNSRGPSSSPASSTQQRASPHVGQKGTHQSSPAQVHALPMQQQQAQQRANGGAGMGMMDQNGQMQAPMNPLAAAAAIQQAQAALQLQQQQQAGQPQTQPQPQFTAQQLMAMQAALAAQNPGMQLKLPQNRARALQMAQQAALSLSLAQQQQQQQAGMNNGVANGQPVNMPQMNNAAGMQNGGPQLTQAQIGMGLLQSLQQQINFAQQNQHQPHNFGAALGAAASSMAPNSNAILAALGGLGANNQAGHVSQSHGRH